MEKLHAKRTASFDQLFLQWRNARTQPMQTRADEDADLFAGAVRMRVYSSARVASDVGSNTSDRGGRDKSNVVAGVDETASAGRRNVSTSLPKRRRSRDDRSIR